MMETPTNGKHNPGPSWRGWVVSILAAIVLSVAATLLLGGSFHLFDGAHPGGCVPGSACSPVQKVGK